MPGVEALGGLVGLTHLQQDIGAAHLSGGGNKLGEHEGGDPSSARGRDGGDGRDGEGTFGSHGKTIALVAARWQATTCPALRSSARDGQFDA